MLGAAGALCCLAGGTAMGVWMRTRRVLRFGMLQATLEMLNGMRLLLETERLALPDLLEACAGYAGPDEGGRCMASRFQCTARHLRSNPAEGTAAAYAFAGTRFPAAWERTEEQEAVRELFVQLGSGTAVMRERAAAACIRRLRPVCDKAQSEAEKGGKLCIQLGMLLGLMAGIALW